MIVVREATSGCAALKSVLEVLAPCVEAMEYVTMASKGMGSAPAQEARPMGIGQARRAPCVSQRIGGFSARTSVSVRNLVAATKGGLVLADAHAKQGGSEISVKRATPQCSSIAPIPSRALGLTTNHVIFTGNAQGK